MERKLINPITITNKLIQSIEVCNNLCPIYFTIPVQTMYHTMDMEYWLPIHCFNIKPDMYEISNFGNIRRISDGYMFNPYMLQDHATSYAIATLRTKDGGNLHLEFIE